MAAKQRQNCEENLEEQLAKIDPATFQYLEQLLAENAPAVRKIVQNVLDEPISQEMEKRLHKPLLYLFIYLSSAKNILHKARKGHNIDKYKNTGLNLSDQELLPGKEGREKGKNF